MSRRRGIDCCAVFFCCNNNNDDNNDIDDDSVGAAIIFENERTKLRVCEREKNIENHV